MKLLSSAVLPIWTLAQLHVDEICNTLTNTQKYVLPGQEPIFVGHNEFMNSTLQAVLTCFLAASVDLKVVVSNPTLYAEVRPLTSYSVLLGDELDSNFRQILDDFFRLRSRGIIVCQDKLFPAIIKKSHGYRSYAVVYVTFDSQHCTIRYYNPYFKTFHKLSTLSEDPLLQATNDIAGFRISAQSGQPNVINLLDVVASKMNGTHTRKEDERNDFKIVFSAMYLAENFVHQRKIIYMFQNEKDYALVPRLNKPIPSVHILTDPFDVLSWIMIVVVLTSLALLRTGLGNRKTIIKFLQNICDILGSFTTGSEVVFCREMERWLNAVCILLSVVVINAYQSMIISYLLCPRFYPELDTLELLNESCCWDSDEQASLFQHYNACPDPYMYGILYGDKETGISTLHRMFYCILLDSWTKEITDVSPPLAITSGMFRWSKQTLNEWPMMGWATGDAVVTERIQVMSAVFFAEGALDRFHCPRATWQEDDSRNILGMPTTVDELSLVWGVYLVGTGVAFAIFAGEKLYTLKFDSCFRH